MSPKSHGRPRRLGQCSFSEPSPGDQLSWAVPRAEGIYRGLDMEMVDPYDHNERMFLLEALHPEMEDGLERDEDMKGPDGQPINPALHVTLHQAIADQLLADEPPETWQTVQRLAALGYDWHDVMHLIMGAVTETVGKIVAEKRPFDRADYVRRLAELPGDSPPPEKLG
jgi:hypothetical protein